METNLVRLSLQEYGGTETFYDGIIKSYEVGNDLREIPNTWRITAGPNDTVACREMRRVSLLNPKARVYVNDTLISTADVDSSEAGVSRDTGTFANLCGIGVLADATEDSMPLGWSPKGLTIRDAVTYVLSPWEIPVTGNSDLDRQAVTTRTVTRPVSRTTGQLDTAQTAAGGDWTHVGDGTDSPDRTMEVLDDRAVRPNNGEPRVDWLRRFLARHDLMLWETSTGGVYVGRPTSDQTVYADLYYTGDNSAPREGRIVSSRWVSRRKRQLTSVLVCGRVGKGGATRIAGRAMDLELAEARYLRRRTVSDDTLRDEGQARRKAAALLRTSQMKTEEYECEVAGHGVGRYLLATDTHVRVTDVSCELDRRVLYVVRRSFMFDDKGLRVKLGCIRPGLWAASED